MEVLPVSGRSAALCKVHVKPCWISPCQLPQFTASRVTQCPVQTQQLSRPLCFQELSSTRRLGSTALSRAVSGKSSAEAWLELGEELPFQELLACAARTRDEVHKYITFSPKVFLPLTRVCRDACGYCTFALAPQAGRRIYMTIEEVVDIAKAGALQGCTEALFTLGDKPELLYKEAAEELQQLGYPSTLAYVAAAAKAVLLETGLLPHVNAGVMDREDISMLQQVSVGQGLMLESASARLLQPGGPHHNCPDKEPAARLATIEAAGQAHVPYTSGLLIGIGETRLERIQALLALHSLHSQYGHIQELIIQNFAAKKGTAMENHPEPQLSELQWTIAMARLIFGPNMNIQAPPNLTPGPGVSSAQGLEDSWRALLDAGINDWGGASPLTRDYVNPEKPWPHVELLAAATAAAGKALLPRLTVYPEVVRNIHEWADSAKGRLSPAAAVLRLADSHGLVRGSSWCPGLVGDNAPVTPVQPSGLSLDSLAGISTPGDLARQAGAEDDSALPQNQPNAALPGIRSMPAPRLKRQRAWSVSMGEDGLLEGCPGPSEASGDVQRLVTSVLEQGHALTEDEVVQLFEARGADFHYVCQAADLLRQRTCGDKVTYTVNRNINYTNRCIYACQFCAFSKGKTAEELRGPTYLLSMAEISRRTAEAWDRGATEVCMQGGIHPDFTGDTYLRILEAAKAGAPDMHVHAFSPLEVSQGAATIGHSVPSYLASLRDAGLGSLPGTAAEILDDAVRQELCPDKLRTQQWLDVVEAAHGVGLRTSSTIMFGHCDPTRSWSRHILALRDLQARTHGITEFVPLPFVHMEAPIYLKGRARRGPTLRECILMHAVARLALTGYIDNIQASWIKMGPERAIQLMNVGCNDMGGSIMNETISKAAGASHGQELPPERMEALIKAAGRRPQQRTCTYEHPPSGQREKSFMAAPLAPLVMN
ncbi:hypothetical protein WJX84_009597 [Apatococcus fuscideae]|uniref:FO synthase n=1 Tax=Apatococcus fuscideae TaxID=2026836 RepID=A0AAW1SQY0_9CHLO